MHDSHKKSDNPAMTVTTRDREDPALTLGALIGDRRARLEPPVAKRGGSRPARRGVSRAAVNFALDLCLLVLLLAQLWLSAVVQFVFPPASAAGAWTLWDADYDTWCLIRSGSLALFALAVLIHLVLHWTWVCGFVVGRLSRRLGRHMAMPGAARTLYGVALLIAVLTLLGTLLTVAYVSVRAPGP